MEKEELIRLQKRKYYLKNREKLLEMRRQYGIENKEKIKETKKKYYENNKTEILEKKKIKETCECGAKINRNQIQRHYKTKKHINLLAEKNISNDNIKDDNTISEVEN